MAAFAQDSWKATSQLTVNYGVRWDRIRPWLEKYNQLQTLVKGEQSQVFPGAPQGLVFPGDPGVPDSLAPASATTFRRASESRMRPPLRGAGFRRRFLARREAPASASATGCTTRRTRDYRRES